MESNLENLICRLNMFMKRLRLLKTEEVPKMLGKDVDIKFFINYGLLIKNEA